MAGGVKKPVNVFKLQDLGEPDGTFNKRLWFAVASFSILGTSRGIDEGLITGALGTADFQRRINYDSYSEAEKADLKANISAMVQLGSVAGALIAFIICDKIGRIWATRLLCVCWASGIAIFMAGTVTGNLGALYAGRFIAGIGVGQTPVVGPVYVAEIAPASVRGLCTCFFTGSAYLGVVLAFFSNYGAIRHISPDSYNQWLVPTSVHFMFAGIIFILSFFQLESPRYLVKKGKPGEAAAVLGCLRKQDPEGEYIVRQINQIQTALDEELEATKGVGWVGVLKEMFLIKGNLYRFYLITCVHLLSQWSGAGSITLYAPDLFKLVGIEGEEESLLVTAVFGVIKLIAAISCALFLVDVIGRKRSLMIGITLQTVSMIYVASFLTNVPKLSIDDDYLLPASQKGFSRGAIAMIYISGFGWALGWNSMQYLLTAELFPLRIRALATSWGMTAHFANQYGNSRTLPNMLLPSSEGGITPKGTFWCFAAITGVGGLWVWFFIPETSGRDLESMNRLFELPWYKIGLHGNKHAEARDEEALRRELEKDPALVETHHDEKRQAV